jgi:hypothetical protein
MIEAAHIPRARWYCLRHTADKFDDGEGRVPFLLSFFSPSQANLTFSFHRCAPVLAVEGDVTGARPHRALDIPPAEISGSAILVL